MHNTIGVLGVEQPFGVPPSGKSSKGRNLEARENMWVPTLALSRHLFLVVFCATRFCAGFCSGAHRFVTYVHTGSPILCKQVLEISLCVAQICGGIAHGCLNVARDLRVYLTSKIWRYAPFSFEIYYMFIEIC
jgi:hypothetical protein